jgi:integrase/recombinase XerD
MTKTIYQNEQRKREFIEYLKGAKGFFESSVNTFAEAIAQWQTFTENEDFANFNKSKALAFRDWLKTREARTETGTISLSTQYSYLRRVKKFFTWLSGQPNYKNKVLKNEVEYLRLSKTEASIAQQGTTKKMPTLEEIRILIESIEIKNDIDRRDRAMISFALITGMRIAAITTLSMKNFDAENKLIDQNPADKVKTKNSKRILTTFFPVNWDEPERYFMEWYDNLKSKGFQPNDPIFPATLSNMNPDKLAYSRSEISKKFWSGTNGARKIFEKRCIYANLTYFTPHSFRHLIVAVMEKLRLTEEDKKAISLNLGHSKVATTFGTYGNMSNKDAVEIVKKIKNLFDEGKDTVKLSNEDKIVLVRVLKQIL